VSTTNLLDVPFGRPMIGDEERAAALDALNSPQLVHGPKAAEFESRFAAMLGPNAYATTVSSCTAGLHLIYLHLGLGPGDEVIVPAQTHVATAHAVEVTGARPVFVDCDETGNVDTALVEQKITDRTRAICVVHYPGLPVDMTGLASLAHQRGIFLVEDCALAVGASLDGVACGLLGDAASFSFYPVKHMTTGEGGMVVSRHADVVASVANIKAFGYDRSPHERSVPGIYDIARLGVNYRMNEIGAAIGLVQLNKLREFLAQRRRNALVVRETLSETPLIGLLPDGDDRRVHANYCVIGVLAPSHEAKRDQLLLDLRARGVGLSVHYPVPIPLSTYYRDRYGYAPGEFPQAERISNASIAIPVGPHLGERDARRLAVVIQEALEGVS
jgi:perosamine synthetase